MPSLRTNKDYKKPWHARAKRDRKEYSLGYFATREEALEAEQRFNVAYPSRRSY